VIHKIIEFRAALKDHSKSKDEKPFALPLLIHCGRASRRMGVVEPALALRARTGTATARAGPDWPGRTPLVVIVSRILDDRSDL
jgi:hypothetical protein